MNVYERIKLHIKLLFTKEKELYSFFARLTGYCPRSIALYRQACTHRSVQASLHSRPLNNERLEYLGDTVINTIVADMLYRRYPNANEGFLTCARSRIVSRQSMNAIADSINLTSHIAYHNNIRSHNCSLGGNALEAVVGAIYLDLGYRRCASFLSRLIDSRVNVDQTAATTDNFKSKLLEMAQKSHRQCQFDIAATTTDASHNTIFTATVSIDGAVLGTGRGYSKREAHQQAAKAALSKIKNKE